MKEMPQITESEWRVMKTLWSEGPLSGNQVVDELLERTEWSPRTIKTLLNRLIKKGALRFEKKGREYIYFPLFEERDCLKAESRSFLERFYGGALHPMLSHFLEHESISAEDLEELQRILDEKKGK